MRKYSILHLKNCPNCGMDKFILDEGIFHLDRQMTCTKCYLIYYDGKSDRVGYESLIGVCNDKNLYVYITEVIANIIYINITKREGKQIVTHAAEIKIDPTQFTSVDIFAELVKILIDYDNNGHLF